MTIGADLVDCRVALPGPPFYSTQIPACLWFLARSKRTGPKALNGRDWRGETHFIDARKLGTMANPVHRELLNAAITKIARTYHTLRAVNDAGDAQGSASVAGGRMPEVTEYADVPVFCKRATLEGVRKHGHVLTPSRHVGTEAAEDDGEPFDEKMKRLTATLREQQAVGMTLDTSIAADVKELGYGG